ncbi:signal peptidase II [Candidatus Woesearchaeota archaeon]|nr:signal peptidase II [Candidatus Woesearchaeota archaeon]
MKTFIKYPLLVLVLFMFDQVTKYFLQAKEIFLFPFVSFTYAENTGAAFSLFQNQNFALILISFVALIFILYYFKEYPLALSFILAGLLGNLADRLLFGFVRDFISIGTFPIFNIADSCNTIGIVLLLYAFWKEEKVNKARSLEKV